MFKKFLTMTIICAVILSVAIIASADEITWSFNDAKNELTISGTGKMTEAPWNDEIDITEVRTIVIEEGITSICDNAFCIFTELGEIEAYTSLTTVKIPESVTSIGERAFAGAQKLNTVALPSSLKKLGMVAFLSTGITDVTIPATLTQWDKTTFGNCMKLENVTISDGLTIIPEFAFYNCAALKQIILPESIISIGDYAFSYCTGLETMVIPYGVVSIGEYVFEECESLKEFSIPSSIKVLKEFALANSYTEKIYYQGKKEAWDKINKADYLLSENTELVFYNEALDFSMEIEGEQVSFTWNEIPNVLSYGLAIFDGTEYVTGTEINEDFGGGMSFTCLLEDGKYTARLMLLTADFSGTSENIDFYVGDGVPGENYALTTLKGEVIDGKFYAEAEVVERFDRNKMDMFMLAVYKDGVMLDMVYVSGDLVAGNPFKFGGMLDGCEGAELKAFVWDSIEGMKTLSNVATK
ncbi:MAG: leucine-rich repeat domain-containing protein [Clostridia bacterium]|nr:leucine-rich repeat domain-containing protein [Clostridia bacterium]